MERWVVPVSFTVITTGNWTQMYPSYAPAGVNPATATQGQLIRRPTEGILYSLQVETDGTNGGIIKLYDANGELAGADVSSSNVVTQAQLDTLIARNQAKQIYEQNFLAAPTTPISIGYAAFQFGLLAKFEGIAGAVKLNAVVQGGFYLVDKKG